jgi:DNA-binding MarR family transcriptional regulator
MRKSIEKSGKPTQEEMDLDGTIANWERERPDLDFDWMRIVLRIRRLEKILRDEQARIVPETGGGHGELEVVGQLRAAGPPYMLRPTDLFLALSLTSGTMTGRINRLVALNWVSREASPSDGRAWQIKLTEQGKLISDMLAEHGAVSSVLARAMARAPEADRKVLIRLLEEFHGRIVEELDAAATPT